MKNVVRRAVLATVAAPLPAVGIAGTAWADVSVGQSLKASSEHCGSDERITGGLIMYGPVPTKQHAMISRNCSGSTVERKADVINDWDGSCTSVAPGKAIVLHVVQALPSRTVCRAAKSC